MAHQTLGATVLDRVKDDTEELCKVETLPKLEGRQMVMILAPNSRDNNIDNKIKLYVANFI